MKKDGAVLKIEQLAKNAKWGACLKNEMQNLELDETWQRIRYEDGITDTRFYRTNDDFGENKIPDLENPCPGLGVSGYAKLQSSTGEPVYLLISLNNHQGKIDMGDEVVKSIHAK